MENIKTGFLILLAGAIVAGILIGLFELIVFSLNHFFGLNEGYIFLGLLAVIAIVGLSWLIGKVVND